MKRHPSLIPLSRFHRSMLFLALNAKRNSPSLRGYPDTNTKKVKYAISFYQDKILPHFRLEKLKLFEKILGKNESLNSLIEDLMLERIELQSHFDQLSETTDPATDLNFLGILLEKHVRKEERVLFQKIQEVFSDEELDSLDLDMKIE